MEVDLRRVPLVVRGLLEVDTVRQDMALTLLDEDPHPALLPPARAGQVGEEDPRVQETERFARQVGVGGEVGREIALDVAGVALDPGEHAGAQLVGERPCAVEQRQRPAPGDQPERRLQAARPVDAHARGICPHPLLHVPGKGVRVALISRQPVGLSEREHPLMAVEFPDNLAVPHHGRVERIEAAPVDERRATA